MRFGKRSRGLSLWGRRPKEESEDPEFAPVASEERSALLSGQGQDIDPGPDPQLHGDPSESHLEDPTQRLLTALGRYQRQIARARDGLPQEAWSEECMNQLINAVEIAVAEGWKDVVRTLTETARVLQSYEDAGRAGQAVSFLAESYEILCLMVGDLIVGKIRPGVVEKWTQRYERGLADLNAAGIPLVTDADEGPAPPPRSLAELSRETAALAGTESLSGDYPFDVPEAAEPIGQPVGRSDSDLPTLDELPMIEDRPAGEEESQRKLEELDRAVEALIADLTSPSLGVAPSSPSESPPVVESESAPGTVRVDESQLVAEERESMTSRLSDAEGFGQPIAAPTGVTGRKDLPQEIVDILDNLCDYLSQLADGAPGAVSAVVEQIKSDLASLEREAASLGHAGALKPCAAMREMVCWAAEHSATVDDRFLELAYAFCGLYAEAGKNADAPAIWNWLAEADGLLTQWRSAETASVRPQKQPSSTKATETPPRLKPLAPLEEEAPVMLEPIAVEESVAEPMKPVEEVFPMPAEEPQHSPQDLLEIARKAIQEGNVVRAKLLALEAAAGIAEVQTREAEVSVEQTEMRLKKGVEEGEQARSKVLQAEQSVAEAEQEVGICAHHLEKTRENTETASSELAAVQGRIDDIDEQIQALELKREQAVREKAAAESRLSEARSAESRRRSELDELRKKEIQTRVELEEARQLVKTLERKRIENDVSVGKAREILNRQRASLADIEHMIAQIGGDERSALKGEDELLF